MRPASYDGELPEWLRPLPGRPRRRDRRRGGAERGRCEAREETGLDPAGVDVFAVWSAGRGAGDDAAHPLSGHPDLPRLTALTVWCGAAMWRRRRGGSGIGTTRIGTRDMMRAGPWRAGVHLRRRRPRQRRHDRPVPRRHAGRARQDRRDTADDVSADETTDVGADSATPVSDDYNSTNSAFTGKVRWVQIDVGADADDADHLITPEERYRVAITRQ